MRRDVGPHGLALIKSFESFVGYPYDDLVIVHGKYPEWHGGPLRGTATVGYGHTNAARDPLKVVPGLRLTEGEAIAILHNDLSECVEQINKALRVPVTQGQFDALCSFTFNCGWGNGRNIVAIVNRGNYDGARAAFGRYTRSKGEVLRGLVRRRAAEQHLWDDAYEMAHEASPKDNEAVLTPKQVDAEASMPPRTRVDAGAVIAGTAGAGEAINTVSNTLSDVKMAHDSVTDVLQSVLMSPGLWVGLAIVLGVAVLWWEHHRNA